MKHVKMFESFPSKPDGKGTPFVEYTKKEAEDKMDLVYLETESGFHIALDASYIEQVGDFVIKLPTGEKINTRDLNSD